MPQPGQPTKQLTKLGMTIGSQCLKPGMSDDDTIAYGLGFALHDLWLCRAIHPAQVAGLALEDANDHTHAHNCFAMASTLQICNQPMTPAEIMQATNDNTIMLVVVVPLSLDELIDHNLEGLNDLIDSKVCAEGFLTDIRYKPIGVANGEILIEVTADPTEAIGDLANDD